VIIYLATREDFLKHVREQRIEEEVRDRHIAMKGHRCITMSNNSAMAYAQITLSPLTRSWWLTAVVPNWTDSDFGPRR